MAAAKPDFKSEAKSGLMLESKSASTSGSLRLGALLFVAAWVVHTADHARRGLDDSPEGVFWAGTVVSLLAAVAVTLILVRHPTAPAISAAVFPSIAIGVTASHFLPEWSPFSGPLLVDSASDGWSIVAAGSEIIAAVVVGVLAVRVLARHNFGWRIGNTNWV